MYKCNECGTTFEGRGRACEPYDEFDYPEYEKWTCCPGCGGDDLEKMASCLVCGAWWSDSLCEDCLEKISDGMTELINDLGILEDSAERTVLDAMADWIDRR